MGIGSSSSQSIFQEKLKFDVFSWSVTLVLSLIVSVATILHYVWWRTKIKRMSLIPTSTSCSHLAIAIVVIMSFIRCRQVDRNVLFFQLLRGMAKVHQMSGLGMFYMSIGYRPVVICYSANTFEAILKNPANLRKSFDYSFLSLWLKEGLVTSEGSKWKRRRKIIPSTFHFRILEDFIPVFNEQSNIMVKIIKSKVKEDGGSIDIVPFVTMCTLDIICETAMGIRIRAQTNKDVMYVKTMHKVCQAFVARVMRPWMWPSWLYFSTSEGIAFKQNAAAMDNFTIKVIRDKKQELISKRMEQKGENTSGEIRKKKAFLDLLLDLHLADPKHFSETDVQEEVDSFMFAGHDTTAVGISWTLYLLGLHPDVQAAVHDEIDGVFAGEPDKSLTEEDLRELKYLECVIKEAQRLYSPAPYIGRELQQDTTVDGVTIPKGTTCMLLIHMLHRDENVYPDPEKFDPDRFSANNSLQRHPFAYCPFSAGPRSCIGQKFAMLEEKTVIANFLRNFTVQSIDQRDKLQLTAEMVLRSKNGIRLKIIPRNI